MLCIIIPLSANHILSAGPCIIYGCLPALFRRPFSIALSAKQILSLPTCSSYGRFPALFVAPFFIALSANQILSAPTCIVWAYRRFPALFVAVCSYIAWRHRSVPPLSAPTCIVYGRFPALFRRPFCIPLSTNQILSTPTCISYGCFPALFVTVCSCIAWHHRSVPRCRHLRAFSMDVFRHCSDALY